MDMVRGTGFSRKGLYGRLFPTEAGATNSIPRRTMMKTPEDIKNALNAMSANKRKKVESIVRRHIEACQRMGVEVEYLDRVWIEAIEAVQIGEKFPEIMVEDNEWPEVEPARRYHVYDPPRAEW
jgi:hypothetical protein